MADVHVFKTLITHLQVQPSKKHRSLYDCSRNMVFLDLFQSVAEFQGVQMCLHVEQNLLLEEKNIVVHEWV